MKISALYLGLLSWGCSVTGMSRIPYIFSKNEARSNKSWHATTSSAFVALIAFCSSGVLCFRTRLGYYRENTNGTAWNFSLPASWTSLGLDCLLCESEDVQEGEWIMIGLVGKVLSSSMSLFLIQMSSSVLRMQDQCRFLISLDRADWHFSLSASRTPLLTQFYLCLIRGEGLLNRNS